MSLASVTRRGQRRSAIMFTDTCKITVPDPDAVRGPIDEDTLQYPPIPELVLYGPGADSEDPQVLAGAARIQVKVDINSNVVESKAAEREATYLVVQLQLPTRATEHIVFPVDAVVELLTAPHDADVAGRKFTIAAPWHKSHPVYRRFRVKEFVG